MDLREGHLQSCVARGVHASEAAPAVFPSFPRDDFCWPDLFDAWTTHMIIFLFSEPVRMLRALHHPSASALALARPATVQKHCPRVVPLFHRVPHASGWPSDGNGRGAPRVEDLAGACLARAARQRHLALPSPRLAWINSCKQVSEPASESDLPTFPCTRRGSQPTFYLVRT